jgi:hypothetical protein
MIQFYTLYLLANFCGIIYNTFKRNKVELCNVKLNIYDVCVVITVNHFKGLGALWNDIYDYICLLR